MSVPVTPEEERHCSLALRHAAIGKQSCDMPDAGVPIRKQSCDMPDVGVPSLHVPSEEPPSLMPAVVEAPRPTLRTKAESWEDLPQDKRGMTLQELHDFCDTGNAWIEQPRWRCGHCHKCCEASECAYCSSTLDPTRRPMHDPCTKPADGGLCGCAEGKLQTRNLYEINAEMIVPRCEADKVSYVELLCRARAGSKTGIRAFATSVDTFVSHWWGEEFPKTLRTLENYARAKCTPLPWRMLQLPSKNYLTWSFWICAFVNNQFAVDHAVGHDGLESSAFAEALKAECCSNVVAVLDECGTIYTRIWCAFELFFVAEVLPKKPYSKILEISLANEMGVVSHGTASQEAVLNMHDSVMATRTRDARASKEQDKMNIDSALEEQGVEYEQLDDVLKHLALDGMVSWLQRGQFGQFFSLVPAANVIMTTLLIYLLQKEGEWIRLMILVGYCCSVPFGVVSSISALPRMVVFLLDSDVRLEEVMKAMREHVESGELGSSWQDIAARRGGVHRLALLALLVPRSKLSARQRREECNLYIAFGLVTVAWLVVSLTCFLATGSNEVLFFIGVVGLAVVVVCFNRRVANNYPTTSVWRNKCVSPLFA